MIDLGSLNGLGWLEEASGTNKQTQKQKRQNIKKEDKALTIAELDHVYNKRKIYLAKDRVLLLQLFEKTLQYTTYTKDNNTSSQIK